MTSVIVPPVDLAPGMPSRVVTISATDVTEGGQSLEGQMVRFALSDTLDVSSGGDVIAKTQAEVVLDSNGEGRIRLPVYDEDVKTWCGKDWAILVTATWGSQKAIRVPAGTSSIALSALPPVRPLRGRELQWAITGVSVTVAEGGSWDASLDLSGGILNLGLTVPPGGVSWYKGRLADGTDVDELDTGDESGIYWLSSAGGYLNLPPVAEGLTAMLTVDAVNNAGTQQVDIYGSSQVYRRRMNNSVTRPRGWTAWERVDLDHTKVRDTFAAGGLHYHHGAIPDGTDFDAMKTRDHSGVWTVGSTQDYPNRAPSLGEPGYRPPGSLEVVTTGQGDTTQRLTYRFRAGIFERVQTSADTFGDWQRVDDFPARLDALESGTGGGGGGEIPSDVMRLIPASTSWEVSKSFDFTSYSDGEQFMDWLAAQNPRVSILTLGTSAQGKPIRAFQMGDPTKPTLYIIAGQHGDEVMSREAVYLWARDVATRYIPNTLRDYCIVIAPTINADRITQSRLSATGTDLNRNWETRTTGEVQAAASVFTTHDVVLFVDAHEGGSFTAMQGIGPQNAAVAPEVVAQGAALHQAVADAFTAAGQPFTDYPSEHSTASAMNGVAAAEGIVTYLFESPSLLGDLKWSPDPAWRRELYATAFDAVLEEFRSNAALYSAAKASASE